jgi:hypothetical protein
MSDTLELRGIDLSGDTDSVRPGEELNAALLGSS